MFMSGLLTLEWFIEVCNTDPEDETQYLKEAKGGKIKLCQQDAIKELEAIVNAVGRLARAYHGAGYVLTAELISSEKWLIRCGPMTASITIDGALDAQAQDHITQMIMEMVNNE